MHLGKMIHNLLLPWDRLSLPSLAPRTAIYRTPELRALSNYCVLAFMMASQLCQTPKGLVETYRCVAFVLVVARPVGVED